MAPPRKYKKRTTKRKPARKQAKRPAARRPRRKGNITHLRTEFYSQSTHKVYRRKSKQVAAMQAVSAPSIDVYSGQASIQVTAGIQLYNSRAFFDNSGLKGIYAQMPLPGTVAAGYGVRRLVLDSIINEQLISNVTTAPVEFTIYDISLKKDLPNTWTYVQNSQNYTLVPNPVSYWQEGLNIASNASPGLVLGATAPGSTPFDSQFFKDYFKVERRTVVLLRQGGAHRHIVTFHPNTLVKEDEVGAGATVIPNYGIKRLTRFVMVVAKGFPCADTENEGAPVATTSSAALMIVQTQRIKYQFVLDATSSYVYANGLTNPLATNQFIVNAGSGAYTDISGALYPYP